MVLADVERFEHPDTLGTVFTASGRTGEEFAEVERRENVDVRSWLLEVRSVMSRLDTLGTVFIPSGRTGEEFTEVERRENADVRSWLSKARSEVTSRPSRQASA